MVCLEKWDVPYCTLTVALVWFVLVKPVWLVLTLVHWYADHLKAHSGEAWYADYLKAHLKTHLKAHLKAHSGEKWNQSGWFYFVVHLICRPAVKSHESKTPTLCSILIWMNFVGILIAKRYGEFVIHENLSFCILYFQSRFQSGSGMTCNKFVWQYWISISS